MWSTLWPGDLVGVVRWPLWTGFERGDILVFRDPLQDDRPSSGRRLVVKRLVALPGDILELRHGTLWVNGVQVRDVPGLSRAHLVRFRDSTTMRHAFDSLHLPRTFLRQGRLNQEVPLDSAQGAVLAGMAGVVSMHPMRLATGAPLHIFPFSPYYDWNSDEMGPLRVPAAGDTVRLTAATLPLYDRLISHYEGADLQVTGEEVRVDGRPAETYVVRSDHAFVLGDARDHSADSRYWGFVPMDHAVGRAAFVLLGQDEDGHLERDRWCVGLGDR
jgi:signal peptidase I